MRALAARRNAHAVVRLDQNAAECERNGLTSNYMITFGLFIIDIIVTKVGPAEPKRAPHIAHIAAVGRRQKAWP